MNKFILSPGLWKKSHKILVMIFVIAVCLLVGYGVGSYTTIKVVAGMASGFIDPVLVEQAYFQYQKNIAYCFPSKFQNLTE